MMVSDVMGAPDEVGSTPEMFDGPNGAAQYLASDGIKLTAGAIVALGLLGPEKADQTQVCIAEISVSGS